MGEGSWVSQGEAVCVAGGVGVAALEGATLLLPGTVAAGEEEGVGVALLPARPLALAAPLALPPSAFAAAAAAAAAAAPLLAVTEGGREGTEEWEGLGEVEGLRLALGEALPSPALVAVGSTDSPGVRVAAAEPVASAPSKPSPPAEGVAARVPAGEPESGAETEIAAEALAAVEGEEEGVPRPTAAEAEGRGVSEGELLTEREAPGLRVRVGEAVLEQHTEAVAGAVEEGPVGEGLPGALRAAVQLTEALGVAEGLGGAEEEGAGERERGEDAVGGTDSCWLLEALATREAVAAGEMEGRAEADTVGDPAREALPAEDTEGLPDTAGESVLTVEGEWVAPPPPEAVAPAAARDLLAASVALAAPEAVAPVAEASGVAVAAPLPVAAAAPAPVAEGLGGLALPLPLPEAQLEGLGAEESEGCSGEGVAVLPPRALPVAPPAPEALPRAETEALREAEAQAEGVGEGTQVAVPWEPLAPLLGRGDREVVEDWEGLRDMLGEGERVGDREGLLLTAELLLGSGLVEGRAVGVASALPLGACWVADGTALREALGAEEAVPALLLLPPPGSVSVAEAVAVARAAVAVALMVGGSREVEEVRVREAAAEALALALGREDRLRAALREGEPEALGEGREERVAEALRDTPGLPEALPVPTCVGEALRVAEAQLLAAPEALPSGLRLRVPLPVPLPLPDTLALPVGRGAERVPLGLPPPPTLPLLQGELEGCRLPLAAALALAGAVAGADLEAQAETKAEAEGLEEMLGEGEDSCPLPPPLEREGEGEALAALLALLQALAPALLLGQPDTEAVPGAEEAVPRGGLAEALTVARSCGVVEALQLALLLREIKLMGEGWVEREGEPEALASAWLALGETEAQAVGEGVGARVPLLLPPVGERLAEALLQALPSSPLALAQAEAVSEALPP